MNKPIKGYRRGELIILIADKSSSKSELDDYVIRPIHDMKFDTSILTSGKQTHPPKSFSPNNRKRNW